MDGTVSSTTKSSCTSSGRDARACKLTRLADVACRERRTREGAPVNQCEGKIGGICGRPATWQQQVHAGRSETGRVLLRAYWCDDHAEAIVQKRRREWLPAPDLARLVAETS